MFCLACEQEQGKERGRGKREPVGMAKDFNFQTQIIYFMFKLSIWVASTTTANFESIRQLQSWVNTILTKLKNLSICQMFNSSDPVYLK